MDIQILLALQNFREATGGCLNEFLAFITNIAINYWVIVPALIMFWVVDKKKGQIMLFSMGLARYMNAVLKAIFCVYRPWIRSDKIQPLPEVIGQATGYSFPSGHATSASAFYGSLIMIYKKYKGLCIFFAAMILLTMFSRPYVGVHTPQDVLVGAATGLFAAFVVCKVLAWVDTNPDKDWVVLLVVTLLTAAALTFISLKQYPIDYVNGEILVDPKKMTVDGFKDPGVFFGITLGWFIERRFIKFSTDGTKEQKFLRATVGSLLYVFLFTTVVLPLGKHLEIGLANFVLQALLIVLFMTVYPLAFTKLASRHLTK